MSVRAEKWVSRPHGCHLDSLESRHTRQKCPRGQRARLPVLSDQQGRIQAPQAAFISPVAGRSTEPISRI